MKDIPKTTSNVFIVYSAATGKTNAELTDGVAPGHVRNTCRISSVTPMSVSGRFNRDGLKITPVLSNDKKAITFDIVITKCNFSLSSSFSVTVKTAGDVEQDIEGTTTTLSFKVMCYGFDRVYLSNNFVEYNNDIRKFYNVSLNPHSCNALTGSNIHADNIQTEESGFTLYDRGDVIYYNGVAGAPGIYGVAVSAQTYEGGANVPGFVPNPFPSGAGADAHIIAVYDGTFKEGDVTVAIPQRTDTLIDDVDISAFPAPFQHTFTLHGRVMKENGGLFIPVFDRNNKFLYWERKIVNQIATNTTETWEYRISCDSSANTASGVISGTWYIRYRYYLDKNSAEWVKLGSAPVKRVSVPALDDGKEKTYEAVLSVPVATGWGTQSGDAAYFVDKEGFFHTAALLSNKKEFEPFTVYASADGKLLVSKVLQTYKDGDEEKERILFPDAESFEIHSAQGVKKNVTVQTITHTLIPYAPPAKDDITFDIEVADKDDDTEKKSYVPQALNPDLSDLAITSSGVTAGIWRRYPLQRLIDSSFGEKLRATVSGRTKDLYESKKIEVQQQNVAGAYNSQNLNELSVNWHTDDLTNKRSSRQQENSGVRASFEVSFPLNGVIYNSAKTIASFCGLSTKDDLEFEFYGADKETVDITTAGGTGDAYIRWQEVPPKTIEVIRGEVTHKVIVERGKRELVADDPEMTEPTVTERREEYKETPATGTGDSGVADCYLHIGQVDTPSGRKLTQAASYYVAVSGSRDVQCTETQETKVNGKVVESEIKNSEKTVGVNIRGYDAEAYARTAAVNSGVGSNQQPDIVNGSLGKKDFSIRFSIRKHNAFTGRNSTWEFENVKVGVGKSTLEWKDEDDETHTETFDVDCYAMKGAATYNELTHADLTVASAEFSYTASSNRASLTLRLGQAMTIDQSSVQQYTVEVETDDTDPQYPFKQVQSRNATYEETQTLKDGYTTTYTHIEGNKYTKTHITAPGGRAHYKSTNGTVDDYIVETPPEGETTTETVDSSPRALKTMFENFVSDFAEITEAFEHPSGEWDWFEEYAEYTDAILQANSEACTYSYEYTTTEDQPLETKVSFQS